MDKVKFIQSYISKCEKIETDCDEAKNLIDMIIATFESEIEDIAYRISAYSYGTDENHLLDIKILSEKLSLLLVNCEEKKQDERVIDKKIQLAKLENTNQVNFTQTIDNSSKSTSNAENTNNITISLDITLDNIDKLPDEILTEEEKETLFGKIQGIDRAFQSGDKGKTICKIFDLLPTIAEKGQVLKEKATPLAIAVMPFLTDLITKLSENAPL